MMRTDSPHNMRLSTLFPTNSVLKLFYICLPSVSHITPDGEYADEWRDFYVMPLSFSLVLDSSALLQGLSAFLHAVLERIFCDEVSLTVIM